MNVLISSIAIKDSPTGVFSRSFNLAIGLVQNGNNVTLLCTDSKLRFHYNIEVRNSVKIVAFPTFTYLKSGKFGYSIINIILRLSYILFRKYNIVHADQHRPASFIVCFIYRLFHSNTRLICDWQDVFGKTGIYDYKSKYWKWTIGPLDNYLEKFSIKKSDGVIVLSKRLFHKSIKIRGENKNIFKLWGGSDTDSIKFVSSQLQNRHKFNIPDDEFVIIFVGLAPMDYQNNILIFNVIKELRIRGLKIVVAKTGEKFSDSFITKHGIGDEIVEVGYIKNSDYGDFLSCANVFMLVQISSTNNLSRWPNVIGDYLAAGRPIIMNIIGEFVELKKNFSDAIIDVKNNEENYLINELTNIFNKKNEYINSYENIAEFAKNHFSWYERAKELSCIYKMMNNK